MVGTALITNLIQGVVRVGVGVAGNNQRTEIARCRTFGNGDRWNSRNAWRVVVTAPNTVICTLDGVLS